MADADLQDVTLRQIVRLSLGGPQLRVRISNRYGIEPLWFTSVHVARPVSPATSAIVPATDTELKFAGKPDVIVPAGADYLSDPISYAVPAFADLAITLHIEKTPKQQTSHPGSRATSYFVHGNQVSAAELKDARTVDHWYFIAGVDVLAGPNAAAVVVLGDSITDGRGSTTNGNDRWTNVFARRLQANPTTASIAILNHGIGGNRILLDSLGPNALARFDHDVLAQAGARWLIVLEGINDIGTLPREGDASEAGNQALAQRIIAAYQQMIARAHTHGIRVIGATTMPFAGSNYAKGNSAGEAARRSINDWIRTPGNFDAVVDFDKAIRDPEHPEQMLAKYDTGDHLHPSVAGHAAMAEAIPLSLFEASDGTPKIALTFDDLPAHSVLPPGTTRLEIAQKIIAAMRDAQMPPVYGLINGALVEKEPDGMKVLSAWVHAGNPLGNHTWSHPNLNQLSVEEFEKEIVDNEPLLTKLASGKDWRWFRYPFLSEGDTSEKKAAIRNFLGQRGYKIAGVTMSFGDYLWNEPYARCKAKSDNAAIELLESSYLAAADESIRYYRNLSRKLYGRDIPYVLLMHIGAFDAEMLPRLLNLYRTRGFRFVTLEEAERDEFYSQDVNPNLPAGVNSLESAMRKRKLELPARANTNPKFDEMCR